MLVRNTKALTHKLPNCGEGFVLNVDKTDCIPKPNMAKAKAKSTTKAAKAARALKRKEKKKNKSIIKRKLVAHNRVKQRLLAEYKRNGKGKKCSKGKGKACRKGKKAVNIANKNIIKRKLDSHKRARKHMQQGTIPKIIRSEAQNHKEAEEPYHWMDWMET